MITAARPTERSGAHYYYPHGAPCYVVANKSKPGETRNVTIADCRKLGLVPSPTTICRLLHRPALVQWQIEQGILACLTTPRIDGEELDAFVERVMHTDRVQDEERNAAAERGRAIHAAIQATLEGQPFGEWQPFIIPVINLIAEFGRVVATEKTIIGDGYCGMTDLIVENPEEEWVFDYKTTGSLPDKPYDEHRLQLSAYAAGLGNTGVRRIRCANIYISRDKPGEIKLLEIENWQQDYKRFRLLLEFWRLTTNNPKPVDKP